MEIEIEKFRHKNKKLTTNDYSLAIQFCVEKNVETGFFRRFWQRFLPEMNFVMIEQINPFTAYYIHEINIYTIDFTRNSTRTILNWQKIPDNPKILDELAQFIDTSDEYHGSCEWRICGIKNKIVSFCPHKNKLVPAKIENNL